MKKTFITFALALICAFLLISCGKVDFKVNFVVDGEVYSTVSTGGNETVKMPDNPTKEGYTFDGWYWDKDEWQKPFTANSLLDAPLSSDMNVYCKWAEDKSAFGKAEIVSAEGFTFTENDGFISVANSTETFSFINKITVSKGANFVISKDIYGAETIATKTIPLEIGDNIIYLLVTSGDGNNINLYTMTVRRRPIYTVGFYTNGGTAVASQQVEENDFATKRIPLGYYCDYNFHQPILSDIEIKLKIKEEMDNFYFNSTIDSCIITGIKNKSITQITIPDYVTSIGKHAFDYCIGLTSVTIGNGVTSIENYAFLGCYKLVEVYNKSALNITKGDSGNGYVGSYAKEIYTTEYTSKLSTDGNEYIIYTDGTNKILMGYAGTETELTLPNYITSIYQYAFYGCSELTSITIGNGVTRIENYAFLGCSELTSVKVNTENVKYRSENNCLIEKNTNVLILGCKNSIIPDSVTSIGDYAFYGCSGLTCITIPNGVTSIGNSAFAYCNGLTNVTIGNGVTSIGDYAFSWCSKLTSITILDSITSIGIRAFDGCRGLTSVTIGNGVTSIGDYAFDGCSGLTSVTIPDSVTSIGSGAFNGCSGLTSVTIGKGVTSIGDYAFDGCSELTSVKVNTENVKYRSENNCLIEKNTNVLILGCKNSIIPDSVTSIGDRAFSYCSGLTSITIPDSVTSIGNSAFRGCSALTRITFNGTKWQWQAISKGTSWHYNVPWSCLVHCTDGNLSIGDL